MTLTSVQQSAYDSISSSLSTGFLNGVNEGDLNSVRNTLADLGATDADAVIDAMKDSGLLQKLADESNDGEFIGMGQDGFSTEERQSLFNDLAGKLDGDSLAAVSSAFAEAETGHDDFRVVNELADAVADRASSQVKLDYIQALSDKTGGEGITTRPFMSSGSFTNYVDSEAGAIGTVISSMSGSYAEAAFESLSDDALADVLQTGVDQNEALAGTVVTNSFDSTRFESIVRAAATTSDPALKARVFDAAGDRLGSVLNSGDGVNVFSTGDDQLKGMSSAMNALLDSDTNAIMQELTYNTETQGGDAMTHFSEAMIATGQTEGLSDIMLKLQFGDGLNENAVTRLDEVTTINGQDYRQNAGALGYFVGAAYAGAADHSDDVKAQQEAVTGLLDFVAGKIPLVGGQSAGDLTLGQDVIGEAVEAAINDPGLTPAQQLETAALPQDGGRLAVGDNITEAFDTTLNRVRRAQE